MVQTDGGEESMPKSLPKQEEQIHLERIRTSMASIVGAEEEEPPIKPRWPEGWSWIVRQNEHCLFRN
jgi:hypothetical protein